MQINVHTHVFNFEAILTKETVMLLNHRLTGKNMPGPLREVVIEYLRAKQKKRNRKLSPEDFHRSIRGYASFKRLLPGGMRRFFDRHLDLPSSVDTDRLLMSVLEASLTDRDDTDASAVMNAIEWLRIGLMSSIDAVTDDLMAHLDDGDVVVVLPMDIIGKRAGKQESGRYLKQLEDTLEQALRYPGRVLPFAMVNPARKEAFRMLQRDVERGACVGLKLYPSLGYSVWDGVMKEVLRYCDRQQVPVLLHCNDSGFRKSKSAAAYCRPDHWKPVLDELPNLKVCFGHFGGETEGGKPVWTAPDIPRDSWAAGILDLMEAWPGRVFADVSYHVGHLGDDDTRRNYLNNMRKVMDDATYRSQVLWGTDYHLLRMDRSDTDYTESFASQIGADHYALMSRNNPAAFLGLPDNGRPEGANIARHVDWLAGQHARPVHGRPAEWLIDHPEGRTIKAGTPGVPGTAVTAEGAGWDVNNYIHTSVFNFLWHYNTPSFLSEGMRKRIEGRADNQEAKFEAMGRVPVGELSFHQDVAGDRKDREQAIRSFSNRIDYWFSKVEAFRKYNDDTSVYYRKMIRTCSEPNHTIPDIAEVMGQFYRVKSPFGED